MAKDVINQQINEESREVVSISNARSDEYRGCPRPNIWQQVTNKGSELVHKSI